MSGLPSKRLQRTAIVLAIAASVLLHFGFLTYLRLVVLPPERVGGDYTLNVRIVRLLTIEEEEEKLPDSLPPPDVEPTPIERAAPRIEEPQAQETDDAPEPSVAAPTVDASPPQGSGQSIDALARTDGIALPSGGTGTGGYGTGGTGSAGETRVAIEPSPEPPRADRRRERPAAIQLEDTSVAPVAIAQVPPLGYPKEFRDKGIEGRVVVQCIITERGQVRACRHKSGPEELGEYAISIVRSWQFEPGKDHAGRSVPVAYTFRFPFRLR